MASTHIEALEVELKSLVNPSPERAKAIKAAIAAERKQGGTDETTTEADEAPAENGDAVAPVEDDTAAPSRRKR